MLTVTFICLWYVVKHMHPFFRFSFEAIFYITIILLGIYVLSDTEKWSLGLGLAFGSCVSFFTRGLKILKDVLVLHRHNCGFMVLDCLEQIEESA